MSSTPTALRREGAAPSHRRAGGSPQTPVHERSFRPDIEGLRAIAIGTVLLYHAGLPFLPGGFIGVDVFFVISGFLITGLLVSELERDRSAVDLRLLRPPDQAPAAGHHGRAAHVGRRCRWLVPVAAAAARPRPATSPRARSTSSTGASPTRPSTTSPQGEDPSPVLHFWSLAVEEQFYVVWPLLLIVAALVVRRRGWRLRPTLLA